MSVRVDLKWELNWLSDLSSEASVWEIFNRDLVHPLHKPIWKPFLQIGVKFDLWSESAQHITVSEKLIRTQTCNEFRVEVPALQYASGKHWSEPLLCHQQPNQSKINNCILLLIKCTCTFKPDPVLGRTYQKVHEKNRYE